MVFDELDIYEQRDFAYALYDDDPDKWDEIMEQYGYNIEDIDPYKEEDNELVEFFKLYEKKTGSRLSCDLDYNYGSKFYYR